MTDPISPEGEAWVFFRSGVVWWGEGGLAVEFVVSPRGICHEPSPASFSMSLAVCGGSIRFEYNSR